MLCSRPNVLLMFPFLSFALTGSNVTSKALLNATTGQPPHAAITASSRHRSSTTGMTHMSSDREELALFRELFEGYDKRLRPALRKEDNVTVTLGISVNQLIDIVRGIWFMFSNFPQA